MNNKKFYKLTNNYKDFLSLIDTILIDDIDDNTSLNKIIKIHQNIEIEIPKYNLEINDLNHLLKNYEKENSIIHKLKKLVYYKNFFILKKVMRTNEWKVFLINLTSFISEKFNKIITIKQIEKHYIELLKQYLGYWNGFWKFFILNKNFSVKKIMIIDPDDYNYIYSCINN